MSTTPESPQQAHDAQQHYPQRPGQMPPGWPPPGVPASSYAAPQPAPRKRRRWPWIVGAIVALFVVIGIAGGGGETGTTSPGGPVPSLGSSEVVYEIESDGGGTALITYTVDEHFNIAQENGAVLPWTKTVDVGTGVLGGAAQLSAQGDASVNSISCRVSRDGEVLSENTSAGQFAIVTCSGF